jgi:predicted GIY-YIG superfamily endonuclease
MRNNFYKYFFLSRKKKQMDPLVVHPVLYVLSLEDDCWYVGISYNLNHRLSQHWTGKGAKWTRHHPPQSVAEVVYPASLDLENQKTKELMERYGKEKVRGGSYCA